MKKENIIKEEMKEEFRLKNNRRNKKIVSLKE